MVPVLRICGLATLLAALASSEKLDLIMGWLAISVRVVSAPISIPSAVWRIPFNSRIPEMSTTVLCRHGTGLLEATAALAVTRTAGLRVPWAMGMPAVLPSGTAAPPCFASGCRASRLQRRLSGVDRTNWRGAGNFGL